LVKVRSAGDTDVTFQTAEFFADGRRANKVVSNSGVYDATERYFYDGQKIIEIRDGSGNVKKQFIHGTQYIDELIMERIYDKGDLYVHQDANWNVIAATDMRAAGGGIAKIVERYVYTPYGEVNVFQETSFGDRDGDEDVDSTDKGTVGTTCTGTVTGSCRLLDLDFDGDYDSADATKFDALTQGIARHPGKFASGVEQPFGHQGLQYEAELEQYQNRARQYYPEKKRFAQRDPLGTGTASGLSRKFQTGGQARTSDSRYSPSDPAEGGSESGSLRLLSSPNCVIASLPHGTTVNLEATALGSQIDEHRQDEIVNSTEMAPHAFELYVYDTCNPLRSLDPSGMIPLGGHNPNIPGDGFPQTTCRAGASERRIKKTWCWRNSPGATDGIKTIVDDCTCQEMWLGGNAWRCTRVRKDCICPTGFVPLF
jgi:RHS repeat-associated protein